MKPCPPLWLLALPLALGAAPALAADFAAQGAKAQLTVEYLYESVGRKANAYDSREWRVRRGLKLSADLVAKAPAALSQVNAPDAPQMARIGQQQAQAVADRVGDLFTQARGGGGGHGRVAGLPWISAPVGRTSV